MVSQLGIFLTRSLLTAFSLSFALVQVCFQGISCVSIYGLPVSIMCSFFLGSHIKDHEPGYRNYYRYATLTIYLDHL